MPKVTRKISRKSTANPIIGQSIAELPSGDLPALRNVLAKALWIKESAVEANTTSQTSS